MMLKIIKVRPNARLPERATPGSAGLDLCACIDAPLVIPARGSALVDTGIAIALPGPEFAAFVFARSGLGIKHGIGLLNGVGVIDSDYRGEIRALLINLGAHPFEIVRGMRIAQMVVSPIVRVTLAETEDLLDASERGDGGFGSTGVGEDART